jgi:hypothetical protein
MTLHILVHIITIHAEFTRCRRISTTNGTAFHGARFTVTIRVEVVSGFAEETFRLREELSTLAIGPQEGDVIRALFLVN